MALATKKAQARPDRDHYLELIQKFPLRPIRSDKELAQAIKVVDSLIIRGDLDCGERDYLVVLTDLVEKYEADEHPMPPVSDAAMLRHLIEARGITQSRLAADVDIPGSTISEILAGKRKLSRRHIGALAKYFGINPGAFPI
jgi:HTH-type transcriptional regulator / antitoxin HigA